MQLICTPVRSRSMTRLGCRTQARRVFRQGNGITPTSSTLPNISLQFAVAQACVRPPFSTWTLSGARTNSGGSRGGNYPLAVAFSLSRDIGTCQYPGGHHKYQSQRDDECNENPGIAHALFGLRQRATASLDLTGSPDRAGRRAANLFIDAQGNRTGIEIRHESRRPCYGCEWQDTGMSDELRATLARSIADPFAPLLRSASENDSCLGPAGGPECDPPIPEGGESLHESGDHLREKSFVIRRVMPAPF